MRDCERCINARPYGGENDNRCSAWSCEFIDRAEAIKIYNEYKDGGLIVKDKAIMILEDRLQLTAREDESISKSADADMLLNSFKGAKKLGVDAIKYYVDNTPTIDLVRCGECKRSGTDGEHTFCMWLGALRKPTDFCSYGERRADEPICEQNRETNLL